MKQAKAKKTPMTCCYKKHAECYGYRESVILFHFMFWVDYNRDKNKHFHKEHYWTFGSIRVLSLSYFPFWSEGQIRRGIESLIKQDVIMKDNFNVMRYDKTSWYALKDEEGLLKLSIPFDEDGIRNEPMY